MLDLPRRERNLGLGPPAFDAGGRDSLGLSRAFSAAGVRFRLSRPIPSKTFQASEKTAKDLLAH